MVKVKFLKHDDKFVGVECSGHCEYNTDGEDIVCSSLSSIVQTAVLGILHIVGANIAYEVDERDGYLYAMLPKQLSKSQEHDADVILRTAYLGASDLYENYSDFISLEVE